MTAFEKMHGNGNDFVVIDALTSKITFSKALVKRMAHRKLGVGFDPVSYTHLTLPTMWYV